MSVTFDVQPTAEPPPNKFGWRQVWNECRGCARWYAVPVKELNRGRWVFCSRQCCGRYAASSGKFAGAKNPRWLGGVSKDNMRYRRRQIERHPVEEAARQAVSNAKRRKRNRLVPQPCPCGETKVQAHHTDYTKPLDVVWLCRPCHDREHAK